MEGGYDLYYALLGNYVSYERMFPLAQKILYDYRAEKGEVDIYIDLNSYMKPLWYSFNTITYKNINVLTANIINCCAHYRNYFWTRHYTKTNFYLVLGSNCPDTKPPEYNAHYKERVNTAAIAGWQFPMIEFTKKALGFLCKYLPQIYFIDGENFETGGVIYTLIERHPERNAIPKVVLSRDAYCYQLVAYCPNTFLLRPKKKRDNGTMSDLSWLVMKENLYDAMRVEMGYKRDMSNPGYVSHLDCVLAFGGLKARHVRGILPFSRACNLIATIEQQAPEQLDNAEKLEYSIKFNPIPAEKGINAAGLSLISNMLDIRMASSDFKQSPLCVEMDKSIVDLFNPQSIMEISDHEYTDYPLELMEL